MTAKQAQRTTGPLGTFDLDDGTRCCQWCGNPVANTKRNIDALVAALRLALPYLEQAARSERIALRLNGQSNVLGQQALESARAALAAAEGSKS